MPIYHAFVDPTPDGPNTNVVRPSDWNAALVGTNPPDVYSIAGGADLDLSAFPGPESAILGVYTTGGSPAVSHVVTLPDSAGPGVVPIGFVVTIFNLSTYVSPTVPLRIVTHGSDVIVHGGVSSTEYDLVYLYTSATLVLIAAGQWALITPTLAAILQGATQDVQGGSINGLGTVNATNLIASGILASLFEILTQGDAGGLGFPALAMTDALSGATRFGGIGQGTSDPNTLGITLPNVLYLRSTGYTGPGTGTGELWYSLDASGTNFVKILTGALPANLVSADPTGLTYLTGTDVQAMLGEADAELVAQAASAATNTADIATNTSDIATNTTNIATNTSDITELEADVTELTPLMVPVSDADIDLGTTALATAPAIGVVSYTALTANRTVTLPPAIGSQDITVMDTTGLAAFGNQINVTCAGTDVILRAFGGGPNSSFTLPYANAMVRLVSPAAGQWEIISGDSSLIYDDALGPTVLDSINTLVGKTNTVRFAAGVPTGGPSQTELPIAFDSTPVSGGVYYWDGAAWNKGGSI